MNDKQSITLVSLSGYIVPLTTDKMSSLYTPSIPPNPKHNYLLQLNPSFR